MRLLGLDFGSKTVGVAVSDELGLTATGLEIVRRTSPNKLRKTLARIEKIIEEYNIEKIILGYPVMLDGSEGERVEKTKEFASMLERRTGKEIIFQDERLTTVAAHRAMLEADLSRGKRKKIVDKVAATYILQGYLDKLRLSK